MSAIGINSKSDTMAGVFTRNGLGVADGRGVPVIQRARHIARTLGVLCAARYMRARGWSVEGAMWVICGVATRSPE